MSKQSNKLQYRNTSIAILAKTANASGDAPAFEPIPTPGLHAKDTIQSPAYRKTETWVKTSLFWNLEQTQSRTPRNVDSLVTNPTSGPTDCCRKSNSIPANPPRGSSSTGWQPTSQAASTNQLKGINKSHQTLNNSQPHGRWGVCRMESVGTS